MDKFNKEESEADDIFSVVVVTKKSRALDTAIYISINGEGSKKFHASGVIRSSSKKLGIKGKTRKDNPTCFLGKRQERSIKSIARGMMRSAEEISAENIVRRTKTTTSVFVAGFPVV
ncbi:MAG: hypothetical protein QCI00_00985 [Candidatus Thermoplasmatota archaeon]|nr:hypothetical protein [Candidatus Thermoplasmatota archaeon]